MGGQRYIEPENTKDDFDKEQRKERMIDTLIIIVGLVLAGSANLKSYSLFSAISAFLGVAVLAKAGNVLLNNKYFPGFQNLKNPNYVFYFLISIFYPLIFFSFFQTKIASTAYLLSILGASFFSLTLLLFFTFDADSIIIDFYYMKRTIAVIIVGATLIYLVLFNDLMNDLGISFHLTPTTSLFIAIIIFALILISIYLLDNIDEIKKQYKQPIKNEYNLLGQLMLFYLLFVYWNNAFMYIICTKIMSTTGTT